MHGAEPPFLLLPLCVFMNINTFTNIYSYFVKATLRLSLQREVYFLPLLLLLCIFINIQINIFTNVYSLPCRCAAIAS